ncbi:MAG: type VII toxin-antitoxin system MntA family adenylyltransferase antitoxin [Bacillota bacterium]
MLNQQQIETIKDFLIAELSPSLIYLFGSVAQDKERPTSDIDLAFLADTTIDHYHLFLLANKLADKLQREVDLIDLQQASTVFKAQIIQGELIYVNDQQLKQEFELQVLRQYAKLNEERAEIINKKSGREIISND